MYRLGEEGHSPVGLGQAVWDDLPVRKTEATQLCWTGYRKVKACRLRIKIGTKGKINKICILT